jgi:hypothetical protein
MLYWLMNMGFAGGAATVTEYVIFGTARSVDGDVRARNITPQVTARGLTDSVRAVRQEPQP